MEPAVKHIIYSCKDFTIYFERVHDGPLMFHIDFKGKWNKTNKYILQNVVNEICGSLKEPILALPLIDDAKMRKFTKLINFKKIQDFECYDKVVRPLYMWSN